MIPKALEDYAAMRMAGEDITCLCDEYAHLVLHQAAEIQRYKRWSEGCACKQFADRIVEQDEQIKLLKEKIKSMRWPAWLSAAVRDEDKNRG